MTATPQTDAKYRRLVILVRALVGVALAAATVALLVQVFAGSAVEMASRWACLVVAAGALTAAATLGHAYLTLEGAGFERFVRDVVGARARA